MRPRPDVCRLVSGLLLAGFLLASQAEVFAQATNGITTAHREGMTSGGGRVGSGNPMSAVVVIGQPVGGIAANGAFTVQGGYASVQPDPAPPPPPDTTPPSGSVSINAGAAATNTFNVTLTLSATDNSGAVSQMQCSNDNVTYSTPETYATSKSWTLSGGDGIKTVYVKFSDPSGNWSTPASDSITLDTTPPAVAITTPSDGTVFGAQ